MEKQLKMKIFIYIILLMNIHHAFTLPADNTNILNKPETIEPSETETVKDNSSTVVEAQPLLAQNETKPTQAELETSENDQKEESQAAGTGSVEPPDNEAAASSFDPSVYGGLITPDAFQQYVNQFGTAFPYAAPYPAPVYAGYMPPPPPPVYPSPYVVQTGYEGYLVPSTTDSATSTNSNSPVGVTTSSPTTALMHPLAVLSNIISTLMMSTVFRIIAGVVSTLGMVFFSGAIMNFLCNYTPLCDMSFRAVTYLRRRENAERMGRMIAEGMTTDRVKRASEFVQNAIKIYQELQGSMATNENNEH